MGNIEFKPEGFVDNLKYMGLGMLAIVIVIGVIILVTTLLNYTTGSKIEKKTKLSICGVGVIASIALILVLVLTDGSCTVCRKDGEYELGDKKYCKEHYEEAIQEAIRNEIEDLLK